MKVIDIYTKILNNTSQLFILRSAAASRKNADMCTNSEQKHIGFLRSSAIGEIWVSQSPTPCETQTSPSETQSSETQTDYYVEARKGNSSVIYVFPIGDSKTPYTPSVIITPKPSPAKTPTPQSAQNETGNASSGSEEWTTFFPEDIDVNDNFTDDESWYIEELLSDDEFADDQFDDGADDQFDDGAEDYYDDTQEGANDDVYSYPEDFVNMDDIEEIEFQDELPESFASNDYKRIDQPVTGDGTKIFAPITILAFLVASSFMLIRQIHAKRSR